MLNNGNGQWLQGVWQEALNAFGKWQAQLGASLKGEAGPEAMGGIIAEAVRQQAAFLSTVMRPYLMLPPLGVGREAVLKMTAAAEAHQRLASALTEFLPAFSQPIFTSIQALPRILDERGVRIENADDLYRILSEVLSRHYQDYLNSPAGVARVGDLINAFVQFKQSLDEALAPVLKLYGIPTKEEMDDVYSGLQELKKRQRRLLSSLADQQATIEALDRQIRKLQDQPAHMARTGRKKSPGKKKPPAPPAVIVPKARPASDRRD